MTRDVDMVVQISEKDIGALLKAFQKDFYIDEQAIEDAIEHQSLFNIVHNGSIAKLDLIVQKDTPYHKKEFERRKLVELADFKAWVVSAEDLVISKLDWAKESHSPMQLKDLENLFRELPQLDRKYIESWVDALNLESIYGKVKK